MCFGRVQRSPGLVQHLLVAEVEAVPEQVVDVVAGQDVICRTPKKGHEGEGGAPFTTHTRPGRGGAGLTL